MKGPVLGRVPIGVREIVGVAAVLLVGAIVRAVGLRLGLPFYHHWDEWIVTDSAKHFVETSDTTPVGFTYGAPLMRLSALAFSAARALGSRAPDDGVTLRWIARIVGCAISSTGIVAVYVAGRAAFARRAGFVAAACFALASEPVLHARYGVPDACVMTFTAWSAAFAAVYLRRPRILYGALGVLAAALSVSFKINGAIAIVFPMAAFLARPPEELAEGPVRKRLAMAVLLGAGAAVPAIFLRLNPHFVHAWRPTLDALEFEILRHYPDGHLRPYHYRELGWPHLGAIARYLLTQSFSPNRVAATLLGVSGLAGALVAAARRSIFFQIALLHAGLLCASMAFHARTYFPRTYLPVTPVLALGFGFLAVRAFDLLRRRLPAGRRGTLAAIAVLGVPATALVAHPLWVSIETARLSDDARTRAIDWIAAHADPGAIVCLSPYVTGAGSLGDDPYERDPPKATVLDYLSGRSSGRLVQIKDPADAERQRCTHLVVSSRLTVWDWRSTDVFEFSDELRSRPIAAEFPFSPYEDRLDIVPLWRGRVSARVYRMDGSTRGEARP